MIPYIVLHVVIISFAGYILLYVMRRSSNTWTQRLMGRHVVVTGGSSGIGRALAVQAARNGANVTVVARNVPKLLETVEMLQKEAVIEGQDFRYVSLDCVEANSVRKLLTELDDLSPVYMLVNCAGIATVGRLEDVSVSDMHKVFETNVFGTILPIKALVARMKARREGVIVITGSQASLLGLYGYGIYAASKFALKGFAESIRMELSGFNVSVTLALPPDTLTAGFEEEDKIRPKVTKLLCNMGGLYKAQKVADTMLTDALDGCFLSYVGFSSFLSTTLCGGFVPINSIHEFVWQIVSLGALRVFSVFYLLYAWFVVKYRRSN